MEVVLKNRAALSPPSPPPHLLCGSTAVEGAAKTIEPQPCCSGTADTAQKENKEMKQATPTTTKARKQTRQKEGNRDGMPQWFMSYIEERRPEMNKRWEEAMRLEKEKIDVMKNLIELLKTRDAT